MKWYSYSIRLQTGRVRVPATPEYEYESLGITELLRWMFSQHCPLPNLAFAASSFVFPRAQTIDRYADQAEYGECPWFDGWRIVNVKN